MTWSRFASAFALALVSSPALAAQRPGEGAFANYDFVPGNRVLFTSDFTDEQVGNFPRRLTLSEGNLEIVDWKGGRYLRANSGGASFTVNLPIALPDRFTMEFDYVTSLGWPIQVELAPSKDNWLVFGPDKSGVAGDPLSSVGETKEELEGKIVHARVLSDGRYTKVYMNETRVANIPNAALGRGKTIKFLVTGSEETPMLITNLRVAASDKSLYDALAEKGRVATQGILFDVGSDRIRPESTPTLKEIGAMLATHPELRLRIEGHTDNVGTDASNKSLSEKRAAAVRAYLVATNQVSESRLEAAGLGATKPVAANTTAEGRAQNRRVELVKL